MKPCPLKPHINAQCSLCLGVLLLLLLQMTGVAALPKLLQVTKSVDISQASVRDYQWMKFRLAYNCSSTTSNASGAVLTDVLDPNLDVMGLIGSIHTTGSSYNATTRTVTFTFRDPLPAGSSGEVFIQARFKPATLLNTVASNTATFSASNSLPVISNKVQVTAINPILPVGGAGTLVFTKGMSVVKSPDSASVDPYAGWTTWNIRHGNTGAKGQDVRNYVIEDVFPPGTMLDRFNKDGWAGTSNPVTVYYKTNLNATYRQWGTGPRYTTGASGMTIYPSELKLLANEYVTALKWSYGTLVGGGSFHPSTMTRLLYIVTRIVNPTATVSAPGTKLQNCATISAQSLKPISSCGATIISSPGPNYGLYHWVSSNSAPYDMGETINITASMGVNPASTTDLVDPSLGVLLPKEVDYVGNPVISGVAYDLAGKPSPAFQKIDNFNNTGRTLVRWLWGASRGNGWTIKAQRDSKYFSITFSAKVKPWTPNGNYVSTVYGSWTPAGKGYGWFENDTGDWNGNSNITEVRARQDTTVWVETAGGSAGFDSQMFVKGELDSNWTKFPQQGLTVPGGKADYQITFTNPSGVTMTNLVLIDILPGVGDRGVIDLSPRGSQWAPYLASQVLAPAGTVFYSLSSNPCRDELTPLVPLGCETPNWSVVPPADITKVRSLKIDFTTTKILPGDTVSVNWAMRAPLNAPTNGEVAWNSFGYRARRDDNGTLLLASEPVKTGIAIRPPTGPFYGDRVWNDLNFNGIQDDGEPGVNGVRVELYKDNGDGINNPANDTMVQFTVTSSDGVNDGAYLFSNTGQGNYYAVVIPPPDWGISPAKQGSDDTIDSDGESFAFEGARAARMPITSLANLEEERDWDLGIFNRTSLPAVWSMLELPDNGGLIMGGRFKTSHGLPRRNIVKVTATGALDPIFNPGTGFDGTVRSMCLMGDKILVGGEFKTYNGVTSMGLALLDNDGNMDALKVSTDSGYVRWVAADKNGMYVGGLYSSVGGVSCHNIGRYRVNGKLDLNFNTTIGANGIVNWGALQPDGRVIIVGDFTAYDGTPCNRIARLHVNGKLDPTFKPSAGANKQVFAVKLLDDGRMIVSGAFSSFNGIAANGTMRLLANGDCDPTFNATGLTVDSVQTTN